MKRFLSWALPIYLAVGVVNGLIVGFSNWGLPGLNMLWLVTMAVVAWPVFVVPLILWMAGR